MRALYFKQAHYGVFARMALILTVLNSPNIKKPLLEGSEHKGVACDNPKCITRREYYLPKTFRGKGDLLECEYCDHRILV